MKSPYQIGAEAAYREKVAFLPLLGAAGSLFMHGLAGQALMGAGIGGAVGALTSKPGERLKGTLSGAGWGALGGGMFQGLRTGAGLMRGIMQGTNAAGQKVFMPATNKFLTKGVLPKGGWFREGMSNLDQFHPGAMTNYLKKPGWGSKLMRGATSAFGVGAAGLYLPSGPKPDALPMSNLPPGMS